MIKLIQFGAEWCKYCHRQDEIMKDFTSCEVKVVDVDNDKDSLTYKYNVSALPALIIIDSNGKELKKFIGITSINTLNKALFKLNDGQNKIEGANVPSIDFIDNQSSSGNTTNIDNNANITPQISKKEG